MSETGARSDASPDTQTPTTNAVRNLAHIVASLPEAVLVIAFDGTLLYLNPAAEQRYGYDLADSSSLNLLETAIDEKARDQVARAIEAMRTRDETWTSEVEFFRRDGTSFPGRLTLAPFTDDAGDPAGVVAIAIDITQHKRTEQRLAIQYAVSNLLSGASSLESVGEQLLQAICTELEWDWCALWEVDDARGVLRCVAVWHRNDPNFVAFAAATRDLTFSRGTGLPGRAWESGEPIWSADYGSDPNFIARTPRMQTGIHSAMAVPIRLGEREVRGVIEFMSQTWVARDEDVVDMVAAAARQIGQFLERQQATALLRENEERLRQLEESNVIGSMRATLDGAILAANDALLSMLGYTRDDLAAGLRWDTLTPEEWRVVDDEIARDLLTTGRTLNREKEYFRKDGSRVAVLLGGTQLNPGDSEIVMFVVDITRRKQAEYEHEQALLREQAARIEANAAQMRAERLLEVTAAYSRARTPEEIAAITVDRGVAALGASSGLILFLDESKQYLTIAASSGDEPDYLSRWGGQPIPRTTDLPVSDATLRQESIWISGQEELFERYPATRTSERRFPEALVAIPLISSGDVLGVLRISYSGSHDFTPSERVFADTLGRFCAQALERARLFTAEKRASEIAGAAQGRAERLLEVTAALSRALTPTEVAEVAIEQGLSALGVDAGLVALLNEDGTALNVVHSRGYPAPIVERWNRESIPIDRPVPIADAAYRGEPVWLRSREEMLEQYPRMANYNQMFSHAFAALPLVAGSRVYGVLGLSYGEARSLDLPERTYIRTLARLSSQAIERANLYSREREARLEAEAAQERLALLAEAGEILTSSLDTSTTLAQVARILVPRFADWCAIDVLDEHGLPDRVTVTHTDPEKVRWAEEMRSRFPYDPDAPSGLANVLRTGKPEFYPHISDEMLQAAIPAAEQLELIRAVGFSSALIVPMIARGRTVGAITLVYAESGRQFDEADLALVEGVAHRSALAIDNARLFEQAQQHGERMDSIATLSRAFAEANLDQNMVVDTLGEHVATTIGDWSVIRLLSSDGQWLEPAALHHPDPEVRAELEQLYKLDPLRWGEGMTGQVAATGEALLVPHISIDNLRDRVKPNYLHMLERHAMHSALIVPMRRGQVIGTIALFRASSGQPYTEEDRRYVQDVADRAALSIENAQLFHQAREAVRLREEFLSIASHEMRTPLTTITGFAHLLNRQVARGQIDPGRFETITSRLLSEAQRLDQLVGDLLDVSRIQQGRLDIRPEPCDLSYIVYEVADRLVEAQEPGQKREVIVDTPGEVIGVWDHARMDQVVTNLLSNALKYSTDGAIRLAVGYAEDDSVMLTVSDQGIGISKEQQATLFEPFMRGDSAHLSSSGTGLGLYITRQIVERHGGTIEVESEPGQGTTFIVHLPRETVLETE